MHKTIYPCLWFDQQAAEAAAFYLTIFPRSTMLHQNNMVSSFTVMGSRIMALNGGPTYQLNPAVSLYTYCGSKEETERLYKELSNNGKILMPLDKYEWSATYAWVIDKFGVSWQLDMDDINSEQKIVPSLLFANEKAGMVKEAIDHYLSIFPHSQSLLQAPYPPSAQMPEGRLLFAQFKLDGYIFNAMSSTLQHDFDFSPATSFVVECKDQQEIDHYWERLGAGGHYSMCGWLQDRFGVSWQIIPAILSELMADPDKAEKTTQAFMQMKKFDIQKLEAAAAG